MSTAPTLSQLPASARRHLAAATVELVWNPHHTATWQLRHTTGAVLYLKATWADRYPSLDMERDRSLWLRGKELPVPEVVDADTSGPVHWLLTVGLPGRPATDPDHLRDPERTVPVLAEGLRALHEVDPDGCPFDTQLDATIDLVAARIVRGEVDPAGFHDTHRHLTPAAALERVRTTRPAVDEDVVVCHGDYCFPNTMLDDHRTAVVGYLDLGEVGIAGRWRDLAVGTWSTTWNVGPGYEQLFLDAYGVEEDVDRRDLYRLLYDLES